MQDLQEGNQAYFAASVNEWSCDRLGVDWLEKVFNRHTKQKGTQRQLLLVNRHFSYVNMQFIKLADCLQILVMILPPHSIHRLQLLDVGLFQLLATAYTNELNSLIYKSIGIVSISKCMF